MSIVYGYARVSTAGQNLTTQRQLLRQYDENIKLVEDKSTGRNKDREGLTKLMNTLQAGDTVVITRIDRIARNVKDLLLIAEELEKKGVTFVILDLKGDKVNTSTPMGKFMITVLGAVAELEINTLDEKRKAGMQLAKENGKHIGRKADLTLDHPSVQEAIKKFQEGKTPVTLICEQQNINRMKFYRLLKRHGITREATL
ncbi:recombinase family protein [Lysinibacillus sphaericus]|uniref:recombinase family protein n=1 Tax=Lysinibacillus sphaericus TaxID=1421 RepID=UPI00068E7E24|nr:recombinase family protein [Lysinibacillus sphaericus]QTB23705.1 recombinase family protein [Lysinibacillus sphaericus]